MMIYLLTALLFINGVLMLVAVATRSPGIPNEEWAKSFSAKALKVSLILLLVSAIVAMGCRAFADGMGLGRGTRLVISVLGPGLSLLATLVMLVVETPRNFDLNVRRLGRTMAGVGVAFVWLLMIAGLVCIYVLILARPYGWRRADVVFDTTPASVIIVVLAVNTVVSKIMSWIRPMPRTTDRS